MFASKRTSLLLAISVMLLLPLCLLLALRPDIARADDLAAGLEGDALSVQGDSIANATSIPLNVAQSGMTSSSDGNWYRISLPSAGKLEIVFGGDYQKTGDWRITLYNAAGEVVGQRDYSANNTVKKSACTTGLAAGTYYIQVEGYYRGVRELSYSLTPSFTASDAWEAELNDTVIAATAITNNKEISGNTQTNADEDWYKVTLPSAGKLEIVFGGDYQKTGDWRITLYNAASEVIGQRDYSANNTIKESVCTTGLPSGTYYIEVDGSYRGVEGLTYVFTPIFTASDAWEAELNDTIATANELTLGKEASGGQQSTSDEDWFKIALPKPSSFAVRFGGDYQKSGSWQIRLYDAANNKLIDSSYSASNTEPTLVCMKNLNAGTYYINVDGSYRNVDGLTYYLTPCLLASKPETITGLVHNGNQQVGVQDLEGSTLSGTTSAVDAGEYTATATLDEGYIWADGSRDAITLKWSIAAASDSSNSGNSGSSSGSRDASSAGGSAEIAGQSMYRLYNPWSGEHFYTSNASERENVLAAGWVDEGEGWKAPQKSDTPVFRMYNPYAGEHHYCMDAAERDNLIDVGWEYEGIGWYSDDEKRVPLYRDYNPNEPANNHNYTTDKAEHDYLVSLGWMDEGVAWYGV